MDMDELKQLLIAGFQRSDEKMDLLAANQELQHKQLGVVQDEVHVLYAWKGRVEERLNKNSMRAAATSDMDLEQEARLAHEAVARTQLEARVETLVKTNEVQLAILTRLDKVFGNSSVKVILAILATAAASWAASKGLK